MTDTKTMDIEVTGVTIHASQDGIEIGFEDAMEPVIFIERFQGHPRATVFANPKSDQPTHVIDFQEKEAA